jgi:hypothetical protein
MTQTAHNLAFYARSYCDALARRPNMIDAEYLNLINAAIALLGDDLQGAKDELCFINKWDGDGYPVDDNGQRRDADRYSMPWEV